MSSSCPSAASRAAQCDHRRRGRGSRSQHVIRGNGILRPGRGRCGPASPSSCRAARRIRPRCSAPGSRQRQWRDDRHDLARGRRPSEGPVGDHQHAQRRRRPRCDHRLEVFARHVSSHGGCRSSPRPMTACLNDSNGFHVKPQHVTAALDGATRRQGGGGLGRRRHRDDRLASRAASARPRGGCAAAGGDTVGVLVQCTSAGGRISGSSACRSGKPHRAGPCLTRPLPATVEPDLSADACGAAAAAAAAGGGGAGLDHRRRRHRRAAAAHQLKRIATRASLGVGRQGGFGGNGSGEIFALSRPPTPRPGRRRKQWACRCCPTSGFDPLFGATVLATEAAIMTRRWPRNDGRRERHPGARTAGGEDAGRDAPPRPSARVRGPYGARSSGEEKARGGGGPRAFPNGTSDQIIAEVI